MRPGFTEANTNAQPTPNTNTLGNGSDNAGRAARGAEAQLIEPRPKSSPTRPNVKPVDVLD